MVKKKIVIGVDGGIQMMFSRETDPFGTVVFSVCAWARERVQRLVKTVRKDLRGEYGLAFSDDPLPPAYNDAHMYEPFMKAAEKVGGPGFCLPLEPSSGSEDFACYEQNRAGLFFGLGLRNDEKGFNKPAHTCDWNAEESGVETGVRLFVQFVPGNMRGVPGRGGCAGVSSQTSPANIS